MAVAVFDYTKEVLSAFVQCHVKKILTQTTQSRQGVKLPFAKFSKLILLSSVHSNLSRDKINITATGYFCKALDSVIMEVAIAPICLLVRFSEGAPPQELIDCVTNRPKYWFAIKLS